MTIEVEGPDGSVIEFPDGTPDGVMRTALMKHYGQQTEQPNVATTGVMGGLNDLAQSLDKGLAKGVAGWLGGPAALAGAVPFVADHVQSYASGKPYERVKAENDAGAILPTTALDKISPEAVERGMREHTAGGAGLLDYTPRTKVGEYAQTVGEFLPAGLLNPAASVLSALGSETAGQLTKGGAMEPYARLAGAVATPGLLSRAVTPIRTDPARVPFVQTLENEGVNLTAGQRTGSKGLQYMESALGDMPGTGGVAARRMEDQGRQFNQAVARRMGEDAEMLTPDVMQGAANRLGGEFQGLSARNTLQADQGLVNDLSTTAQEYARRAPPSEQRARFNDLLNDVIGQFQGGRMPGDVYQSYRSRFSQLANETSDRELGRAVRGLRDALDGAMDRSILPQDAGAWAAAREQYGNMKSVEKAMGGAGERIAQGYVSPSQLRTAAKGANPQAYARGQSDLGELARAAEAVMKPLPNSGTAPRQHAAHLLGLLGGAGGMAAGGLPGALMGAVAPAIAGRGLLSRPVQAYLGNSIMPAVEPDRVASLLLALQRGQRALQH